MFFKIRIDETGAKVYHENMKSKDAVKAETSLRDYIIEEYENDTRNAGIVNLYKYRGLSLDVNWRANTDPFFTVQIMAFEASFKIMTGEKIQGGLNDTDVKIIQKWASQGTIKDLLMRIWGDETRDARDVNLKPFDLI